MNQSTATLPKNARAEASELSRVAALAVSQLILVQSLGKFTRRCIGETCKKLAKKSQHSANSAVNLDTFIAALAKNTNAIVRELEREILLWLMGKTIHPMKTGNSEDWTLMDSETSDMEVLKVRMENQLNEFVRFEWSNFRQRWKKVQGEKFDPESAVITPIYQGLFIIEFLRNKKLPEEITNELTWLFIAEFPTECKKIHIELNSAFQAMGLQPGGWEVFNGDQQMTPSQVL